MIGVIRIKDYTILAEKHEKKAITAQMKQSWFEAGRYFHLNMRERRFTQAHATKAGYAKRSVKYTQYKFRKFGHTRPLEFSGTARRLMKSANISSTSKGARVAYPGARVFNFRNPKSDPKMSLNIEFRSLTFDDAEELEGVIDHTLEGLIYQWHTNNMDPEVVELLTRSGLM
jgi:hypothetical protein